VAGRWWLLTGALRICTDERVREEIEKEWSRPAATLLGQWIPLTYFMLDCADEVRDLAHRLFPSHA